MIILDLSGSMFSNYAGVLTRIEVAKDAVNMVIDGLTNADWVGLVTFGDIA
jgi:hypothetical protein